MRRILYISTLAILYFLTTAKSCDNREKANEEQNQNRIRMTRDSLKSAFGSDTLSKAALRAFEYAAIIKLSDFADYLAIFRDTSLAVPFREKAREMILALFISGKSSVRVPTLHEPGGDEFTIEQLLKVTEAGSFQFGRIIPGSTRVYQELKRSGDSIFVGQLSFSHTILRKDSTTGSNSSQVNGIVEFSLTQHQKKFGPDTLMLWDVFLGNVE